MKDYEKIQVVKSVAPPAIWVPLLFIAICAAGAKYERITINSTKKGKKSMFLMLQQISQTHKLEEVD